MALNRSDKSRILRRYFPGMTRNSEMSTEPNHPQSLGRMVSSVLRADVGETVSTGGHFLRPAAIL